MQEHVLISKLLDIVKITNQLRFLRSMLYILLTSRWIYCAIESPELQLSLYTVDFCHKFCLHSSLYTGLPLFWKPGNIRESG